MPVKNTEASSVMLLETMVDFETWISIGMRQCAPTGPGTGPERERVFSELVRGWNAEKDEIKSMSESEVRSAISCP